MTASPPARTKVLYIGGMGRSGSTLLDVMLARVPGIAPVGELRYLWERGPVDDVLCSCKMHFSSCPFWQEVGDHAFGGWRNREVRQILALSRGVDRHRYLPLLALSRPPRGFSARLEEFGAVLEKLYSAIRAVSGCEVVVDSSKDPPYAFVLRTVSGIDLRLLHLVRDSRGVAHSWSKKVVRPEVVSQVAYMDTYGPADMALRWIDYNVLFHLLGLLGAPRLFLRYETLVSEPVEALTDVLVHAGSSADARESALSAVMATDSTASLHTISGNPVRFAQAPLRLQVDDAWKTRMAPSQRRLVFALTWPLLLRYGYISTGRSPGVSPATASIPGFVDADRPIAVDPRTEPL